MEEMWEVAFKEYLASLLNEDEKLDEKVYAETQATFKAGWMLCYERYKVSAKTEVAKALSLIRKNLSKIL